MIAYWIHHIWYIWLVDNLFLLRNVDQHVLLVIDEIIVCTIISKYFILLWYFSLVSYVWSIDSPLIYFIRDRREVCKCVCVCVWISNCESFSSLSIAAKRLSKNSSCVFNRSFKFKRSCFCKRWNNLYSESNTDFVVDVEDVENAEDAVSARESEINAMQ